MSLPVISIVIPIHNEESILRAAILELRDRLEPLGWHHEILLAENGSTDATVSVAEELARRFPEVSTFSVDAPNYGLALRTGIARARGEFVVCEEVDLCDVDFHVRAMAVLEAEAADLVIGSKLAVGANDDRPWPRHLASQLYNGLLRVALGFRGTDTHGLKALRKSTVGPIAEKCVIDHDVFASELVVRAYREGLDVREIPVQLREKRPPSINLLRRVPRVLRNLARLGWAIRVRG